MFGLERHVRCLLHTENVCELGWLLALEEPLEPRSAAARVAVVRAAAIVMLRNGVVPARRRVLRKKTCVRR
jgi:hypothetical protein